MHAEQLISQNLGVGKYYDLSFVHSFIRYNELLVTFKLVRPPAALRVRRIKNLFSCARVLQSELVLLSEFAAHVELHFYGCLQSFGMYFDFGNVLGEARGMQLSCVL